jgi:hypothetical protein
MSGLPEVLTPVILTLASSVFRCCTSILCFDRTLKQLLASLEGNCSENNDSVQLRCFVFVHGRPSRRRSGCTPMQLSLLVTGPVTRTVITKGCANREPVRSERIANFLVRQCAVSHPYLSTQHVVSGQIFTDGRRVPSAQCLALHSVKRFQPVDEMHLPNRLRYG